MASLPPGAHTFDSPAASNRARQFNGHANSVRQGDEITHYHGSSPTDFRTKLMRTDDSLASLGAADPEAVMKDIVSRKHPPLLECYSWIEDDPNLKRWETDATCRLLRIGGDPGKGKTMLMISLVQRLGAMENKSPMTYFFCQSSDSRHKTATSVLQGLIWYLVKSNAEFGDEFDHSFETRGKTPFCTPNADFAELSMLLSKLLAHPKAKRINVIVDALDECDVDKDKLLSFIAEDSKRSASRAKWLVSSRNHWEIEEELDSPEENLTTLSLELNSAHVAQAVNTFIEIQIEALAERKKSLSFNNKQKLKQELTRKADATFLWVALVFKQLEKVAAWEILEIAEAVPETLPAFYGRMLQQMLAQRPRVTALCKSVMRAVVVAERPLSLAELGVVAELDEQDPSECGDITDFIFDLVRRCGSFVDIRVDTCYFVHQSAKDFFLNSEGKAIFEEGLPAEHEGVLYRSLDTMSRVLTKDDICSLTYPGSPPPDSQKILESSLWPIRYSCSSWVVHLEHCLEGVASGNNDQAGALGAIVAPGNSGSSHTEISRKSAVEPSRRTSAVSLDHHIEPLENTITARVYDFLQEKALRWVEALALLGQLDIAITALRKLGDIWTETTNTALGILVQDLQRVIMQCGGGIEEAPLQVYSSALAFAPLESTTRQRFEGGKTAWLTRPLPQVALQWDAALHTLEGHSNTVWAVAFSSDGRRLASCSGDNTVRLWDTDKGTALHKLEGHSDTVWAVTFSSNGRRQLASCSEDKTVRLWDADKGTALHTLEGHSDTVEAVTFSPDGRRLASCSGDKTVRLWDADKGTALHKLEGHSDSVWAVTFSSDGQQLASCSLDNTVRLWDADKGTALHKLEGYSNTVWAVTFSSDGQRLASCSWDKTVRLWDTDKGENLGILHDDGRPLSSHFDHNHGVSGVAEISRPTDSSLSGFSISDDRDWILHGNRKLLWIPVQHRPGRIAFRGPTVAVGLKSGIVYRVGINLEKLPS